HRSSLALTQIRSAGGSTSTVCSGPTGSGRSRTRPPLTAAGRPDQRDHRSGKLQRAWHPDDRPTMKLDQCLVLSRIEIADHRDSVLTEGIPNAIDPRDQNEPGDPLSLSGHRASPTCPTHGGMIERIE